MATGAHTDFGTLLDESISPLSPFPTEDVVLPPEYAEVQREEKQGWLTLKNRFISIKDLGEMRCVRIAAPKIDIITVFFFPIPYLQLPVFGMEFVVLGERPIVGVIDAPCLMPKMTCSTNLQALMQSTHEQFPDLVQADDPPEWYAECRSGMDFFVRPRTLADLRDLALAHLQIWNGVVELFHFPLPLFDAEAEEYANHIQAYKDHHRINSPGLRLMNRSFGEAWTRQYLTGYLFN